MSADVWADTFAAWYRAVGAAELANLPALAQELLPYFVMRGTSFWGEVVDLSAEQVEHLVQDQAALCAERLALTPIARLLKG